MDSGSGGGKKLIWGWRGLGWRGVVYEARRDEKVDGGCSRGSIDVHVLDERLSQAAREVEWAGREVGGSLAVEDDEGSGWDARNRVERKPGLGSQRSRSSLYQRGESYRGCSSESSVSCEGPSPLRMRRTTHVDLESVVRSQWRPSFRLMESKR